MRRGAAGVEPPHRVIAVCVKHKVGPLIGDVIDDSLHVPWIGSPRHVPLPDNRGVHGRNYIPHDSNDETYYESHADQYGVVVILPPPSEM